MIFGIFDLIFGMCLLYIGLHRVPLVSRLAAKSGREFATRDPELEFNLYGFIRSNC